MEPEYDIRAEMYTIIKILRSLITFLHVIRNQDKNTAPLTDQYA